MPSIDAMIPTVSAASVRTGRADPMFDDAAGERYVLSRMWGLQSLFRKVSQLGQQIATTRVR